jgi:diguanylate cyclase (GGDEF)-like protein
MQFPKVKEIATKEVVKITLDDSIGDAVTKMYANNHRDVVVEDTHNNSYGILKVNDLIRMKLSNIDFDTKISQIKYDKIATINEDAPVVKAMELIDKRTNCLCVVDDESSLTGYISYYDIIASIDPKSILERQTIGEIMLKTMIKFAYEDESTVNVIRKMDEDIDDSIVLLDSNHKAKGIITTKDIVKLFGEEKDLYKPVCEYMSTPIQTLKSDVTVSNALSFIKQKHFKRIIIESHDEKVIGQITQEELLVKVYAKWAESLRKDASQLKEINKVLEAKASKYETLSITDPLTGVYNRSKFEQELQVEIDKIKRYAINKFSVVLFDVDNFKNINDTFGHLEGDTILRKLTAIVKESLRSSDIFARWGGEEFVVLLTHTDKENALKAAEILRQKIESAKIGAKISNITCSFGVSTYDANDTIYSMLKRADEAMYIAKKSGKNRIEFL